MADFNNYWEKRVQDDAFRDSVNQLAKDAVNELIDLNIGEICDDLSAGIEQSNQKEANEFLAPVVRATLINGTPISKALIEEANKALNERMGEGALKAWREVVSQPIDLPPETVQAVVQQPAVKELFINIIHDAIIGFNKKVNPLAGAMGMLGIDKQIKDFLAPFMDQVTNMATEFMVDKKNTAMFQDFAGKVFDIAVSEKPAKYMNLPIEESSKLIADAVEATLNDETFQKDSKESGLNVLAKIKEKFGKQTIREYMNDNNIKDPTRDLTKWELDIACKRLGGPAFAAFMGREVEAAKS